VEELFMPTRRLLALVLVSLALVSLTFLTACGSSSSSHVAPSTPVFTSVPVTAATQDVVYTYQLAAVDPAGGTVTYSLTTFPTGAALSGNTVTWTPTAAQSRMSNGFAVTATTASGGTAQQSWNVTPGGTITVNWATTYWTESGQVQVAAQPSQASGLLALWANPDGSYTVQKSAWTSAGVFSIPNVPGGYYWLEVAGGVFWTNTNTFDAGTDVAGAPEPFLTNPQPTMFDFNLTGLDGTVAQQTPVSFFAPVAGSAISLTDSADSTSLSGQEFGSPFFDWTQVSTAFLAQYVPVSTGSLNNVVLGPSVSPNFSFANGVTNTITETLQPSASASVPLNVPGSQWAPLLAGSNIGPSTPTPIGSALAIAAQPYITSGLASGTAPLSLAGQILSVGTPSFALAGTSEPGFVQTTGCNGVGFITGNPFLPQPAITTDQNFGTLQYGDPFPSDWARTLSLCQEATVAVPIQNSSEPATVTFILVDNATVALSSPLAPVVLPVQNPTIMGLNFFGSGGAMGIGTTATQIALAWSAPSGTAPFGYTVRVYVQTTIRGIPTYSPTAVFSTAGTSVTLPPLAGGNTYVFAITAEADGKANMETGPFRSALPTGYATVVSVPVTIGSGAQMPQIHGDRRVITRLSQAQSGVTPR
jgi:hypothetical protein